MGLSGKVAVVTGGNCGIGMAIVLELAKQGASIAIDYIAHPGATETLEQRVAAMGDRVIGVEADVSKVVDLERLIDSAVRKLGRVDIMATTPASRRAPRCSTRRRPSTTRCSTST